MRSGSEQSIVSAAPTRRRHLHGGKRLLLRTGANPAIWGTLVDLPDTVDRGRQYLAERGLDMRCEFVGQSFFDPLPAEGDAYVLRRVVHDWGDNDALPILRRCADAAGQHGRVVVIEGHGSFGDDPATFAEMNLRMLVLSGGRERTVEAYIALAAEAGLDVADVRSTPLGHVILDCTPLGP